MPAVQPPHEPSFLGGLARKTIDHDAAIAALVKANKVGVWVPATLQNGWTLKDGGEAGYAAYRLNNGRIEFSGILQSGANGTVAFTMLQPYWPLLADSKPHTVYNGTSYIPASYSIDQTNGQVKISWGSLSAIYPIKVTVDDDFVLVADGQFIFAITTDDEIAGYTLVGASAYVTTVASSGLVTVQVRNVTQAVNMLSTPITIDANEFTSDTAATPPVVNTPNALIALDDLISINVTSTGTGARGLGVVLRFRK
jgi:hypothetical protein